MRITRPHLEAKADHINKLLSKPTEYMTAGAINHGHYSISGAYGGFCLHQTVNASGGVRDVFSTGHIPARDLAGLMSAFVLGIQEPKQ